MKRILFQVKYLTKSHQGYLSILPEIRVSNRFFRCLPTPRNTARVTVVYLLNWTILIFLFEMPLKHGNMVISKWGLGRFLKNILMFSKG